MGNSCNITLSVKWPVNITPRKVKLFHKLVTSKTACLSMITLYLHFRSIPREFVETSEKSSRDVLIQLFQERLYAL